MHQFLGGGVRTPFLDLYRASLRSAADVMSASLESGVRFQEGQLDLMSAQLERTAGFWTALWRAAGEAQKSMIDRMQDQLGASTGVAEEEQPEEEARNPAELAASQLAAAVGQARRRFG
jgi:hypothetical protein